jgi:hypothetical protein
MRLVPFSYFLHLLEGETEPISQLLLAHRKHHAARAHSAADMLVDTLFAAVV